MPSTKQPFVLTTRIDATTISFVLLTSGTPLIRVSTPGENIVARHATDQGAKLAAELIDVDLWPAYADKLKPSVFADTLFNC